MADTGAPWNIPYIEPTDLVRNYPVANELMADAIAAGLTAAGNPGIGANVVQTVKTDTFTTTSTAFVDITGYNVTITPSSATSKVLVVAYISLGAGDATVAAFGRLVRNSTDILVGDAAQNRTRVTLDEIAPNDRTSQTTVSFLDSPATTSATAYKIQIASNNGTSIFVNRSRDDTNTAGIPRTASSIIAIEVA